MVSGCGFILRGNKRTACGGGNILYFDCVDVSVLEVIRFYRFQDVTMDRDWVKEP